MSRGLMRVSKNTRGVTLLEVLLSTFLMSVVFLAVSALYVASQRFYFTASDKVMIGYELQYAIRHIYNNAMTGIGDKKNENNAPITVSPDKLEFTVRHIDKTDPDDSPTYGYYPDDTIVSYKIDSVSKALLYDGNDDGVYEESLAPKIYVLASDPVTGEQLSGFTLEGNTLIIKLTGEYTVSRDGTTQRMTLYSSCYPRLASFR